MNNNIVSTYINHVNKSFENAENNVSKLSSEILSLDGMTGNKTRHFYNNILNIDDARYLEIGTWKGSSLCSAMGLPEQMCFLLQLTVLRL